MKILFFHPFSFIRILRKGATAKNELASMADSPLVEETHGFKILIDPKDKGVSASISLFGAAEPCVTEVFRRITKKGMTVLDIGANIGWYTMLGSSLVGTNGKVIAVEPEPTNFEMLSKSVELNRIENVNLLNACVAQSAGKVKLFLSPSNRGGHSIMYKTGRYVESEAITVDQIVAKFGSIDIVKIDAESAEPMILAGASRLLDEDLPLHIIMEYSPQAWKASGGTASKLFERFQIFKINTSPYLLSRLSSFEDLPPDKQSMLYLRKS
ncbi:MAG TPA: FkbM family methyltransferase [Nitrososphaerales archaeon]|nr:FkbM family methyltransferase [Nitrososphaerales archaeon]